MELAVCGGGGSELFIAGSRMVIDSERRPVGTAGSAGNSGLTNDFCVVSYSCGTVLPLGAADERAAAGADRGGGGTELARGELASGEDGDGIAGNEGEGLRSAGGGWLEAREPSGAGNGGNELFEARGSEVAMGEERKAAACCTLLGGAGASSSPHSESISSVAGGLEEK